MSFEYITKYNSPNYTPGRPYGIACIVIHWWDDPAKHPTFNGVISTLCSKSRGASANYVAEAGRVACIVDPDNRSWATGDGVGCNSMGNDKGISIECNPRQSDGDYQTIGELIRNIRKTYGDLPLKRHRDLSPRPTSCPGTYDLDRLDRIARHGAASNTPTPSRRVWLLVAGLRSAAPCRSSLLVSRGVPRRRRTRRESRRRRGR